MPRRKRKQPRRAYFPYGKDPLPFEEARAIARSLKIGSSELWKRIAAGQVDGLSIPANLPANPMVRYPDEWVSWPDWLGNAAIVQEREDLRTRLRVSMAKLKSDWRTLRYPIAEKYALRLFQEIMPVCRYDYVNENTGEIIVVAGRRPLLARVRKLFDRDFAISLSHLSGDELAALQRVNLLRSEMEAELDGPRKHFAAALEAAAKEWPHLPGEIPNSPSCWLD